MGGNQENAQSEEIIPGGRRNVQEIPSRATSNSSRRHAYVSVNHLLSFEVTRSPGSFSGGMSTSPPRRVPRHGAKPGASFTKERFIHANFRFIAREDSISNKETFSMDPDAPLEWNDIELVIVPAQNDATCPICLDAPIAPRLTKCGHFFCWPCILRYASATSAAGSGNWRKCPICFESISVKQLKSVYFSQVTDYTSHSAEVSEIGIPMILLMGESATTQVRQVESHPLMGKSLSDLCPFDKVTFVTRQFVIDLIIGFESRTLMERLTMMDEDDPDRIYTELAMTMVDDRRSALEHEAVIPSPPVSVSAKPEATPPTSTLFFHQSIDGQPFFLCPLSIKMLRRHYGSYDALPTFLCAPVVEIEMAVMSDELRKRHRYLHHIPVGCQFGLCELDLSSVVSSSVLEEFSGEAKGRAIARAKKAHKEEKLAEKAQRREQQRMYAMGGDVPDEFDDDGQRTISPSVPGVATAIFIDDYERFPLPPTGDIEESEGGVPISIPPPPPKPQIPLAGSFASIAATSPASEGFLVFSTSPASTSFGDLSESTNADGKKAKKILLVSNSQRRTS